MLPNSARPAGTTRRHPTRRLEAALARLGDGHGEILHHFARDWASATFAGTRHEITMRFSGAAAVTAGEALIAALPDHEFELPGQIVADATVSAVEHRTLPAAELTVTCALLLLADA